MKNTNLKTKYKIALVLLLVLILIQFFGPAKNNEGVESFEPFLAETNPPENVKTILKASCFDCHSNHTNYPWYGTITPVNYWLDADIMAGKKQFNVSLWPGYSNKKKDYKLKALMRVMDFRKMPLKSYANFHESANLSDEEIASVVNWANNMRIVYSINSIPQ
ncbi:heme-binding domain-containing protein [Bizionia sediminis]|uniref:Heme-binding domain-containing protein n=1 Tax=Bizionia sediminis TaxID=1737064 RepID=A0ABW5KRN5_9FLAO